VQKSKLIIQIPCLNEEDQLPTTLAELPREVAGFDTVEWLVIDDGSTDRTVEVARANGVDHVVSLPQNMGLARAFQLGLDAALRLGADVIVNTDADNQYPGAAIVDLVQPLVENRSDIAVGDRGVANVEEFSWLKRRLQVIGSWAVSKAAGHEIADATSGFRAYNRPSAQSIAIVNRYTYTIESLIQLSKKGFSTVSVPITSNASTRDSRLFSSTFTYIRKNAITILRVFASYEPLRFFGPLAFLLFLGAMGAFVPFIYDAVANGDTTGHLQSIIVGAILFIGSVQVAVLGVVADLIHSHRAISERILLRVRDVGSDQSNAHYLLPDVTDGQS
jgi:glycosyltransferase involved in cell wall biosynthesis